MQTESDLHGQDDSPNVCFERVEVTETDTSPAKTLTILQGASTRKPTVIEGAVDVSELSSRSDGGVSVMEYCGEKLRCLSEGKL